MLGDIFVKRIRQNAALFTVEIEMIRAALDTSTIRKTYNDCTSGTRKKYNQERNFLYHEDKL